MINFYCSTTIDLLSIDSIEDSIVLKPIIKPIFAYKVMLTNKKTCICQRKAKNFQDIQFACGLLSAEELLH